MPIFSSFTVNFEIREACYEILFIYKNSIVLVLFIFYSRFYFLLFTVVHHCILEINSDQSNLQNCL